MLKIGDEAMQKSQFLEELSTITREDIDRILETRCKRIKKISPILIINPPSKDKYKTKDTY